MKRFPFSPINGLQDLSRDMQDLMPLQSTCLLFSSRSQGYLLTRLMIIFMMTKPNPRCGRIPCHIKSKKFHGKYGTCPMLVFQKYYTGYLTESQEPEMTQFKIASCVHKSMHYPVICMQIWLAKNKCVSCSFAKQIIGTTERVVAEKSSAIMASKTFN